jgi:hypothetical protein
LTFENITSQIELLIFGMIYQSVVSANTMFTFENRLDKYWANQPMKYDFNSDYITGRDKSIVYEEEEQNTLATSQVSIGKSTSCI